MSENQQSIPEPPGITAHSAKWGDLPLFPDGRWVASDDDVDAWGDLIYMRALADELENRAVELAEHPCGVHIVQMIRLHDAADMVHVATALMTVPITLTDPWPVDRAAELLAAWRAESKVVAA